MRNILQKLFFLIALWGASTFAGYSNTVKTDSLWRVLNTELKKENTYIRHKEERIKLIRARLQRSPHKKFNPQFKLLSELFNEYSSFRFDSAITCAHELIALAKRFNNTPSLIKSQIGYTTVLMKSGFYKDAFDALATIDTTQLSAQAKYEYLYLRGLLNAEISAYNNDAYFAKRYLNASKADFSRAAQIINADDLEKTINLAFLPAGSKRKPDAEFYYHYLLSRKLTQHEIAIIATRISHAYEGEDKILLLTLAAINDIRSATKETFAIFLLGQEFFKLNRNGDAYICIKEALGNAAFYGTRNRAAQIESILPLITSRLIEEKQHEKDMLWIGIIIFVFVAVMLVIQLVLFRKNLIRIKVTDRVIQQKNAELEYANSKLWESSRIKEELIGLFIKTCSSYIETLDRVKSKAQRNIKLGKYQDATMVLSNVHIQTEKDQLFSTLDRVFLTLFPNFVASFNSLLKPEDQIWLKEGEVMTPTLRIFALIRLGVSDVETISKILDYTVSTVYTYKARIKGKALVSPDVFEQKIMEIKFTDDH